MAAEPTVVADTNALLNLATPVVDGRSKALTGDPLRALLESYDVHVPSCVLGEVSAATDGDDLLSAAADAVMLASRHLTVHDTGDEASDPLERGLDPGESRAIRLANHLDAAMLVTDEFNGTNLLFVALALDDRNTLFATPHVLCKLADSGVLDAEYTDAVLTYYVETKHWDRAYVEHLWSDYLH
jgi:rRNA-processing protein FCF1